MAIRDFGLSRVYLVGNGNQIRMESTWQTKSKPGFIEIYRAQHAGCNQGMEEKMKTTASLGVMCGHYNRDPLLHPLLPSDNQQVKARGIGIHKGSSQNLGFHFSTPEY